MPSSRMHSCLEDFVIILASVMEVKLRISTHDRIETCSIDMSGFRDLQHACLLGGVLPCQPRLNKIQISRHSRQERLTYEPETQKVMSEEQNLDYAIALSLQDQYDKEKASKAVQRAPDLKRIVDKHWELIDPNPDIHQLFVDYDSMYFWKKLTGSGVAVNWSNRMTL